MRTRLKFEIGIIIAIAIALFIVVQIIGFVVQLALFAAIAGLMVGVGGVYLVRKGANRLVGDGTHKQKRLQ